MEHPGKKYPFKPGEKVVYLPDDRRYDFGYWDQRGHAIIYEEGERNMQDSYAVDPSKLERWADYLYKK